MGLLRRKKRICFYGTKIIKTPVRVSFRTNEGRRVTFTATRATRRKKKVCFWR